MNLRSSKWALLLTAGLAIAGCDRQTLYHHYEHTPLAGWEKGDTLFFTIAPVKERAVVQRQLEVRIADRYPFQNLHMVIEQTTFPARYSRRDTINCRLTDEEGSFDGQGLTLRQYGFKLADISVNEGDSLSICIHHDMQRETLPGVADIGLRLTKY